jgi:chromosome partitioning protein
MRQISILNFKGGTGKSSVVINLAHAVAMAGYDVLILDGDRQRNTTWTLLGNDVIPTLADVMTGRCQLADAIKESRENLYVVPSDTDLEKVGTYLKDHRKAYYAVAKQLETLDPQPYLVLIDQAGAYSTVMESLLLASHEMLIPCELEPYSVQGLFDMFRKLKEELEDHTLSNSGIIPYNANFTRVMTKQYIDELREEFEDLVLDTVSTDINVSYAQSEQLTIFEYEAKHKIRSKAASDFRRLAARFLPIEETVQMKALKVDK